ncbi:MAG: DNA repair protein RadA [Lachnospiraceae bacterium]|nr:DNA repair protein RadA [Lachnospiraceae bacterium]
MASKKKTAFFCQQCGYESAKWMGQCPACKEWNSFAEEVVRTEAAARGVAKRAAQGAGSDLKPLPLSAIDAGEEEARIDTHFAELNRVLGGGLVKGSLTLIGGDPGIGKSTILLQAARFFASDGRKVLYVSGEESLRQIRLRADRIGSFTDDLHLYCETNLSLIEAAIEREQPQIVMIDSIQTMYHEEVSSAPGSVSQVRETTGVLMRIAKTMQISVFIVGHVTKEGTVAGPRVLEHMVDTVLYFEGDRHASYRVLRAVKNRFGSTNEIGVFEMREEGLVEVENPSEFMLAGRPMDAPGSVAAALIEGTRPLLIEIQALVSRTNFGYPRRQATGADVNRVNLLMAVLEKRLGLSLSDQDAYVNLAGGMKVQEPALDLGICLAVISSFKNRAIDPSVVAFGEVGLSGEVRAVSLCEQRIAEAAKLGFTTCIVPKASLKRLKIPEGMTVRGVKNVAEATEFM